VRARTGGCGSGSSLSDSGEEDWKEADAATHTGLVKAVPMMCVNLDVLIQLADAEAPRFSGLGLARNPR
jgi:hypothetical protein